MLDGQTWLPAPGIKLNLFVFVKAPILPDMRTLQQLMFPMFIAHGNIYQIITCCTIDSNLHFDGGLYHLWLCH